MFDHFIEGFKSIAGFLPAGVYALAFNIAIIAAFAACMFLGGRKIFRGIGLISVAAETAFLFAAAGVDSVIAIALSAAMCTAFDMLLGLPRERRRKKRREIPVEDFVRAIDRKLYGGNRTEKPVMEEKDIPLPILARNGLGADVKKSLNISHARNIIERLGCFELTAQDRAQVKDVEYALCEFEKESGNGSVFKVNEKLSSLIKILAKYEA